MSRYFYLAVCSSACYSPSERRYYIYTQLWNKQILPFCCLQQRATLNVHALLQAWSTEGGWMDTGQHRRRWPNIYHTLGRCRFVNAASNKHYQTSCYLTQPSKHEALNQCWFDAGPASQMVSQHCINVSCLLGVLTSHILFRTSAWFQNGIINST